MLIANFSLGIKKSEVKPLICVLDSRFFFLLRVLDFHPQVFIDLAEGVVDVVEEFAAGAETPLSASTEAVEEAVEDAMEMPLIPLDEDDDTI